MEGFRVDFHFWSLSSWLKAFSFALKVFFLLISFTISHANHECLSSIEFLILLIWPSTYSVCSFWNVWVLSRLSFWVLVFLEFLLSTKDAFFFMLSCFFLNCYRLMKNFTFGSWFGIRSAATSICIIKFSYLLFEVCLSDVSWKISNLFLTVTIYLLLISLDKLKPHFMTGFNCFLFLPTLKCIFAKMIQWLEGTPSKENNTTQFKVLFIHHFLIRSGKKTKLLMH